MTGTVSFFDATKGYGFIARPGAKDVFVHISKVSGATELKVGQQVTFDVVQESKGPAAQSVSVSP